MYVCKGTGKVLPAGRAAVSSVIEAKQWMWEFKGNNGEGFSALKNCHT